jgi:hypothetical protein
MKMDEQIKELLQNNGAGDIGFAKVEDGPAGLPYAISIVLPLSDAVIDEIDGAPTPVYFHHYRTVNAYIDRLLLQIGLLLQAYNATSLMKLSAICLYQPVMKMLGNWLGQEIRRQSPSCRAGIM